MADPLVTQSELGAVRIAPEAVEQIVGHTAAECYGVVGMAGTSEGVRIDLHVVVEHGLNLAEVASTVRSRVGYEVERLTGLPVAAVEVHIEDVRRSA